MKNILKLEELAQFLFSIYLFNLLDYVWWIFPAWLLVPDVSMLGYLVNTRVGAFTYNLFHHKLLAFAVGIIGVYTYSDAWMLAGIILFAHSAMDRILGYGLKYTDSFQHTHLGWLKKQEA